MKYLKLLFTVIFVSILFTGCTPPKYRGDDRLAEILYYDAPAIEMDEGIIETIEEDEYGRVLFLYSTDTYKNYFLGICQVPGKNETSFYQDYSLIWHTNGTIEGNKFSSEEVATLKKTNDWGKPLNPEKMTVVNIKQKHECAYNWNELIEKYELGSKIDASYAASDPSTKKQLYYIIAEKDGERSLYFYILEDDFSLNEETGFEKMDDRFYFQPQLHEFKVKNGWGF